LLYTEPLIQSAKVMAPRDTTDGSPSEMPVFIARPQGGAQERRPAIILIQEVFGVNPHIQEVVQRFAAAGYVVVAPDLFYRKEHWLSFNYDQFPLVTPILKTLTAETLNGDIAAALDFLASQPDVDLERIGITGYCMGGRLSFVTAATFPERIKASVIYYGGGLGHYLELAGQITCPVLGFFGGLDKHILREHVTALDQALEKAGVEREIHLYPYADHGFFCDARSAFNPRAAADAWKRTLDFFGEHLGPVPAVHWNP
jgi:carboxymethylenebutenolidase